MTTAYFTGEASWARFNEPDKWGKYSVVLALDLKQFKEMKDLGLKNGGKPDDNGRMLVTFRRSSDKGRPDIVDTSGNKFDKLIGNGSVLTVKLETETFTSPKHGKVTRSDLVSVRVDKLVEYEKKQEVPSTQTGETTATAPASPALRPKIPF